MRSRLTSSHQRPASGPSCSRSLPVFGELMCGGRIELGMKVTVRRGEDEHVLVLGPTHRNSPTNYRVQSAFRRRTSFGRMCLGGNLARHRLSVVAGKHHLSLALRSRHHRNSGAAGVVSLKLATIVWRIAVQSNGLILRTTNWNWRKPFIANYRNCACERIRSPR
jgi:hypothetical protein